jgi:hypothetical protein
MSHAATGSTAQIKSYRIQRSWLVRPELLQPIKRGLGYCDFVYILLRHSVGKQGPALLHVTRRLHEKLRFLWALQWVRWLCSFCRIWYSETVWYMVWFDMACDVTLCMLLYAIGIIFMIWFHFICCDICDVTWLVVTCYNIISMIWFHFICYDIWFVTWCLTWFVVVCYRYHIHDMVS